jgi:hypothetical protein
MKPQENFEDDHAGTVKTRACLVCRKPLKAKGPANAFAARASPPLPGEAERLAVRLRRSGQREGGLFMEQGTFIGTIDQLSRLADVI